MNSKYNLNNNYLNILIITILLFLIKWFFSYYNYGTENIFIKVIFNSSGDPSYYPFVHQLSNFNFTEGYSKIYSGLNVIGFPFLVSFLHAIFYKLFGLYSFLILEFLSIFVFLLIFFKIFKLLKFSDGSSIVCSLFLFSIPNIIFLLNSFNLPYIFNLKQLYSGFYLLRFPRPLITNLFLFSYILFILKFHLSEQKIYKQRYLFISGFFIGLLFNSFIYFFLVSLILSIFILIINFRNSIFSKDSIVIYFKFLLIIFVVSFPFILQILFIEQDYLSRVGVFSLTDNSKAYLFKHLFKGFIKHEFLLILFLNIILFFINIKFNKDYKKFLDVFLLLFLSSLIAPIVYLISLNTVTFFSNFIFIIALTSFILLKFNLIILFYNLKNYLKIKVKNVFLVFSTFIFICLNTIFFFETSFVNSLSEGVHFNPKNSKNFRSNFNDLILFLNKNVKQNDTLLLTNDVHTQLWWIFSDKKFYYFPSVFFVALNDNMIETQLINAFKYLKLDDNDFAKFINQNKLSNWRVVNTNNYFFLGHLKYQANYLTKLSKIENYPKETRRFINKKSIHHTNQVILPKNELNRLKDKFKKTKKNPYLKPDIIILNKNDFLHNNIDLNKNFSKLFENQNFILFFKK